jgi:intracellular multiplication protein IcmP
MAQGPQQQSQDSGLGPFWVALLLLLTLMGIWLLFKPQIVATFVHIKLFEAHLIAFFTTRLDALIAQLTSLIPAVRDGQADLVSFDDIKFISRTVGEYTRYPIIVIMVLLAVILFRNDITSKFKSLYNMKALLKKEYINWPQITPVVELDLVSQDITKGPWAMALSPVEFSEKHNLLRKEINPTAKENSRRGGAKIKWVIAKGEAKRVFTLQLGPYWEGPEALSEHARALFAIFAAKMNRDRKGSDALLQQINRSAQSGSLDFTGHRELLEKHVDSKLVKKITEKHAYVLTVMATMITLTREDGVFPCSDFLWLKPTDRRLWYMLNCIGRQTPFAEVAGPFAHWLVEKELRRKSMVPMIDEAVKGLDVAFKEVLYTPKDKVQEE